MNKRAIVRIEIDPHIDPVRSVSRNLDQGGDQATILTYVGQSDLTEFQSRGGSFQGIGGEQVTKILQSVAHGRPLY